MEKVPTVAVRAIVVALILVTAAAFTALWRAEAVRNDVTAFLNAALVASITTVSHRLDGWVEERHRDALIMARIAATHPGLSGELREESPPADPTWDRMWSELHDAGGYDAGFVVDVSGRVVRAWPPGAVPSVAESDALRDGLMTDFLIRTEFGPGSGAFHVVYTAPIIPPSPSSVAGEPQATGSILLRHDVMDDLARVVQRHRGQARTGRTLLVVGVGEDLVLISSEPPPSTTTSVEAMVMHQAPEFIRTAIGSPEWLGTGTDRRGQDVLAGAKAVGGVGWTVMRQFDEVERREMVWQRLRLELAVGGLVLALLLLGGFAYHRAMRAAQLRGIAESEARLNAMIASAQDSILTFDGERRITSLNPAAERLMGLPAEEAVGRAVTDFLPDELLTADGSGTGEAEGPDSNLVPRTGEACRAQGGTFPCEASFSRASVAGREITTVILRDVTERLRFERQAREAEKLEGVSLLAGGIAHDFNNALATIRASAEIVLEDVGNDDPIRRDLLEILNGARRAAILTSQLLAFGRGHIMRPGALDLNRFVRDREGIVRALAGNSIEVGLATAHEPVWTSVDVDRLHQILIELVTNARRAMTEGGRVIVATGTEGEHALLSVSDDGHGMGEEVARRAFEPFFTTGDRARTAGLGLSMVQGIVGQSGGQVELASGPGEGTTVTVRLPLSAAEPSGTVREPLRPRDEAAPATILVVDDEHALRKVMTRSLERSGYRVLQAPDGRRALELYRASGKPIDLLITDLMMPSMGGRELADRIQELQPGVPVLYISGYTDDKTIRNTLGDPESAFVGKPFELSAFVGEVRRLVGIAGEWAPGKARSFSADPPSG